MLDDVSSIESYDKRAYGLNDCKTNDCKSNDCKTNECKSQQLHMRKINVTVQPYHNTLSEL